MDAENRAGARNGFCVVDVQAVWRTSQRLSLGLSLKNAGAGESHGGGRSPVALQREAARKPPRAARASHLMGQWLTPAP